MCYYVLFFAAAGSHLRGAEYLVQAFKSGVFVDNCEPDLLTRVTIDVTVGIALVYFAATCALLLWKLSSHKKLSYRRIQVGNAFFKMQVGRSNTNMEKKKKMKQHEHASKYKVQVVLFMMQSSNPLVSFGR